jgi:hypothetical protein
VSAALRGGSAFSIGGGQTKSLLLDLQLDIPDRKLLDFSSLQLGLATL